MSDISILLGTYNAHKVKELGQILKNAPVTLVGLGDVDGNIEEAREDAETFQGNAVLKASHYAQVTGMITIADDSGLEIVALDGRPGINSARYAETNDGRIDRVLREMLDVPDGKRQARFVCAMALVVPDQEPIVEVGTVSGHITRARTGEGGFGYDPIFFVTDANKTMAELSASEKNVLSHRARAAEKLKPILKHLADQV